MFDKEPKFVIIFSLSYGSKEMLLWSYNMSQTEANLGSSTYMYMNLNNQVLSWYTNTTNPSWQLNYEGAVYQYFALM